MPKFGRASLERRETIHSDLQKILDLTIERMDFSIVEGRRDRETQDKYFYGTPKRSHLKWPEGKHCVDPDKPRDPTEPEKAHAADIIPYPQGYNERAMMVLAGFVLAAAAELKARGETRYDIRWGGDWDRDGDFDDNGLFDPWHFELIERR